MSDGLSLLAVDDELPALHDLARMLRASALGRPVRRIGERRGRARGSSRGRRYDGVFLDVRMPGVDGLELGGRACAGSAIPPAIVFVSAYENAAVEAFELHVLDYLVKPVSRRADRGGDPPRRGRRPDARPRRTATSATETRRMRA